MTMMFTEVQVEAAQCILEAVLEQMRDREADNSVINIIRAEVGTPGLRAMLRDVNILKACDDGWFVLERMGMQGKMAPYDWKYVPWFVVNCLDWSNLTASVTLRPDWKDRVKNLKVEEIEREFEVTAKNIEEA